MVDKWVAHYLDGHFGLQGAAHYSGLAIPGPWSIMREGGCRHPSTNRPMFKFTFPRTLYDGSEFTEFSFCVQWAGEFLFKKSVIK